MNFVDWENEWESAFDAMDEPENDDAGIPGLSSAYIEELYN